VDHARRFPGGPRLHGRVGRGAARDAQLERPGQRGRGAALVQGAGLLTVAAGLATTALLAACTDGKTIADEQSARTAIAEDTAAATD
jgi:hypothetical protein